MTFRMYNTRVPPTTIVTLSRVWATGNAPEIAATSQGTIVFDPFTTNTGGGISQDEFGVITVTTTGYYRVTMTAVFGDTGAPAPEESKCHIQFVNNVSDAVIDSAVQQLVNTGDTGVENSSATLNSIVQLLSTSSYRFQWSSTDQTADLSTESHCTIEKM